MKGRPRMTEEAAAQEAAKVINVAWALRYRPQALESLGFTRKEAAEDFVKRRRRGRVGELVGDTVQNLVPAQATAELLNVDVRTNKGTYRDLALKFRISRSQLAVALVLDDNFSRNKAARVTAVDPTNLKRALEISRVEREAARVRAYNLKTEVTDADL